MHQYFEELAGDVCHTGIVAVIGKLWGTWTFEGKNGKMLFGDCHAKSKCKSMPCLGINWQPAHITVLGTATGTVNDES